MIVALTADTILDTLHRCQFSWTNERELQDGIALALNRAGIAFDREVVIADGDRIDFLAGDVGIEVKIGGSLADLTRQLHRYAQCSRIADLIVVADKRRFSGVPTHLNGKAVHVVSLWGAAL